MRSRSDVNGNDAAIAGCKGESAPNRFIRPRGAIDRLALLLPGFDYNCAMPLFYYAENILIERG